MLAGISPHPTNGLDTVGLVMAEARILAPVSHAWHYPAVPQLIASGRLDRSRLASEAYAFNDALEALQSAHHGAV